MVAKDKEPKEVAKDVKEAPVKGAPMPKWLDDLHRDHSIERDWSKVEIVTTGLLSLDQVTTKGGVPRGIMIDLYGEEGLGKTTMCLAMMAERIRNKELCIFIDVEHKMQADLILTLIPGTYLDPDNGKIRQKDNLFMLIEPESAENTLEAMETALNHPEVRMIVLDSMAALSFEEEREEGKFTQQMALQARKMSSYLRRIMDRLFRFQGFVILINQMRADLNAYKTPQKATGGKAPKFYSSLRVNMSKVENLGKADEPSGHRLKMRIEKCSFGPRGREGFVNIVYGVGYDRIQDLIDCGTELGIVVQNGGFVKIKTLDAEGKVVHEIQGHGAEEFADKIRPYLNEIRAYVYQEVVKRAKKEAEDRRLAAIAMAA